MATNQDPSSPQGALRHATSDKDIGLAELDGFQLPRDVTEEFLRRMQESAGLLGMVDTMMLDRLEMSVPQFGVPQLSGGTRAEGGSRTSSSSVESGDVDFNATDQQYYILVEPERDALKNTHQGVESMGQLIISEFIERFGNDMQLIGMRANAANGNLSSYAGRADLDTTYDGWIAIAEGADTVSDRIGLETTPDAEVDTMPVYDNQEDTNDDGTATDQPLDTETFNGAIQTLDNRFRDTDNVGFLCSPDHVQQYYHDLTGRQDGLGVAVLQGSSDVTPFDYDIVGIPGWPTEYAMLTDPDNLAYGLYSEVEVDQTRNSDKVNEQRLHSRNWMEGQSDFQIKNLQAGTLVTGLSTPNA